MNIDKSTFEALKEGLTVERHNTVEANPEVLVSCGQFVYNVTGVHCNGNTLVIDTERQYSKELAKTPDPTAGVCCKAPVSFRKMLDEFNTLERHRRYFEEALRVILGDGWDNAVCYNKDNVAVWGLYEQWKSICKQIEIMLNTEYKEY